MDFFLSVTDPMLFFVEKGGGKALGLKKLIDLALPVPHFIVITHSFFERYFINNEFLNEGVELFSNFLKEEKLMGEWLSVRSSGADEDSHLHSFAGQFKTFLYQKDLHDVLRSLKECYLSAHSDEVMAYRKNNDLKTTDIKMSVIIQKMIHSSSAGVAFSRNPIDLSDRNHLVVESVFGLGEGLVGGYFDADHFLVHRETNLITYQKMAEKDKMFVARAGHSYEEKIIPFELKKQYSIDFLLVKEIAAQCLLLENKFQYPVDIEWAIEDNKLYLLQMRPITSLPPDGLYDKKLIGNRPTLWDNSNIVESFSGVTTPLTFSYAKVGYDLVYKICTRLVGVPEDVILSHEEAFSNMLGFINGRVYYNLLNWYRVLFLLPGRSISQGFMETMMGVKEELEKNKAQYSGINWDALDVQKSAPKYTLKTKIKMYIRLIYQFLIVKKTISQFMVLHQKTYDELDEVDFDQLSIQDLGLLYKDLENKILREWKAPIINDFLVMIFFGSLRKLTLKWLPIIEGRNELQNDLLSGSKDMISTRPTKDLMEMACWFDQKYPSSVDEVLKTQVDDLVKDIFLHEKYPELSKRFKHYIKLYGFRCANEQKLEESDLHENPTMSVINFVTLLKNKKYSVKEMEEHEEKLKTSAEKIAFSSLNFFKKIIFKWVLKEAKKAVVNRENLRFLRTRSYGSSRRIFNSLGKKLKEIDVLVHEKDIYYLTVQELFDLINGVSTSIKWKEMVAIRKLEFEENLKKQDPPERFITAGASSIYFQYPMLLTSLDLLKYKNLQTDPNVFTGTSCSVGEVKEKALVATSIEEARYVNGQILVCYRTDPGWVPLYPNCAGLAIERGSLLSHSAVVAREMGIPTIVGLNGNPTKKIKSGELVYLNATKGTLKREEVTDGH